MPIKLSVKLRDGRTEVVQQEVPDLDQVKRLWKKGMSLGQIKEELMKKGKKKQH